MCGRDVMAQVWVRVRVRVRVGTNHARELSAATSRVAILKWVRACSVHTRGVACQPEERGVNMLGRMH